MIDNTSQVQAGWHPLIKILDAEAERLGIKVLQVKEKFGGLRYYVDAPPLPEDEGKSFNPIDRFCHLVHAAETLSHHMCEVCGAPGKHHSPKGWIRTLCPEHAK